MQPDQRGKPLITDAEFEVIKEPDQLPAPRPNTKAPEEVPWWIGLALIVAMAGRSLTGGP